MEPQEGFSGVWKKVQRELSRQVQEASRQTKISDFLGLSCDNHDSRMINHCLRILLPLTKGTLIRRSDCIHFLPLLYYG